MALLNNCWECAHRRDLPRNAHIECANPPKVMLGNRHGIDHGWLFFPTCFDPMWMLTKCSNYKQKGGG